MNEFKAGQRVKYTGGEFSDLQIGQVGTVLKTTANYVYVGWDEDPRLGHPHFAEGWVMAQHEIEVVAPAEQKPAPAEPKRSRLLIAAIAILAVLATMLVILTR